jgi:para-nitrobenzyl esterase
VFRLYPLARFPSPFIAYRTVVADSDSVCPALTADRHLSRYIPVFAWENDDADMPPQFYPQFLDPTKPYGAYHIAADPLLFPQTTVTLSPDQAALAAQFTAQATGYSRTGNPTAPGAPVWPRFTLRRGAVMSLVPAGDSAVNTAATIGRQHHCGFWDAMTRQPRS